MPPVVVPTEDAVVFHVPKSKLCDVVHVVWVSNKANNPVHHMTNAIGTAAQRLEDPFYALDPLVSLVVSASEAQIWGLPDRCGLILQLL